MRKIFAILFVLVLVVSVAGVASAYTELGPNSGQVTDVNISTRNMDDGSIVQKLSFKSNREVSEVHVWSCNDQAVWHYVPKHNETWILKGKLTGVYTFDQDFSLEKSWSVKLDQYCYTGWYWLYFIFDDGCFIYECIYIEDQSPLQLPKIPAKKVELSKVRDGNNNPLYYAMNFPSAPYNGTSETKKEIAGLIGWWQYYQIDLTVKMQFAYGDLLFMVNAPIVAGNVLVPAYIIDYLDSISSTWMFSVQVIYGKDSFSIRQYSEEMEIRFKDIQ